MLFPNMTWLFHTTLLQDSRSSQPISASTKKSERTFCFDMYLVNNPVTSQFTLIPQRSGKGTKTKLNQKHASVNQTEGGHSTMWLVGSLRAKCAASSYAGLAMIGVCNESCKDWTQQFVCPKWSQPNSHGSSSPTKHSGESNSRPIAP